MYVCLLHSNTSVSTLLLPAGVRNARRTCGTHARGVSFCSWARERARERSRIAQEGVGADYSLLQTTKTVHWLVGEEYYLYDCLLLSLCHGMIRYITYRWVLVLMYPYFTIIFYYVNNTCAYVCRPFGCSTKFLISSWFRIYPILYQILLFCCTYEYCVLYYSVSICATFSLYHKDKSCVC